MHDDTVPFPWTFSCATPSPASYFILYHLCVTAQGGKTCPVLLTHCLHFCLHPKLKQQFWSELCPDFLFVSLLCRSDGENSRTVRSVTFLLIHFLKNKISSCLLPFPYSSWNEFLTLCPNPSRTVPIPPTALRGLLDVLFPGLVSKFGFLLLLRKI